uniref:Zinc finger protein-like 1 n=1 Tax=Coturnix japonica TaxID=93934 RepID=A0A8C2SMN0_COTJA
MYLNGSHYPLWIWLQFPSRPLGVAVADLFHWRCLSTRYVSLPPHTAPSGFRCPSCNAPLFPPPESRGPVADALRSRLANVAWARPGLGLPLIADADVEPEPSDGSEWGESSDPPAAPEPPPSPELPSTHTVVHMGGGESLGLHGSAPRKALWGRENRTPPPQNNQEDDKYRRRPHGGGLPHRISSPLNGRNTMALYRTGYSTNPRPGWITPAPMLSMVVTAITNPYLQRDRKHVAETMRPETRDRKNMADTRRKPRPCTTRPQTRHFRSTYFRLPSLPVSPPTSGCPLPLTSRLPPITSGCPSHPLTSGCPHSLPVAPHIHFRAPPSLTSG